MFSVCSSMLLMMALTQPPFLCTTFTVAVLLQNASLALQSPLFSSSSSSLTVKHRQRPTSSRRSIISLEDVRQDLARYDEHNPIHKTVFHLPPSYYDDSVTFLQRSTNTRMQGRDALQKACQRWDEAFVAELAPVGADFEENNPYNMERLSMTSPTTLVIQWSVSYIPPTAQWLSLLAKIFRWSIDPTLYNDKSNQVRKFSYRAVFRLFLDAFVTQKLRVPLACIQGTTICEFETKETANDRQINNPSDAPTLKIVSITEDLAYAQELQRGALQNSACAKDLEAFLETTRMPLERTESEWEDDIASRLPWNSVPGLTDPLAIEPMDEEEEHLIPILFLGGVGLFLFCFEYSLAPKLTGQSLLGPPTYIVPPQELNDTISY